MLCSSETTLLQISALKSEKYKASYHRMQFSLMCQRTCSFLTILMSVHLFILRVRDGLSWRFRRGFPRENFVRIPCLPYL